MKIFDKMRFLNLGFNHIESVEILNRIRLPNIEEIHLCK